MCLAQCPRLPVPVVLGGWKTEEFFKGAVRRPTGKSFHPSNLHSIVDLPTPNPPSDGFRSDIGLFFPNRTLPRKIGVRIAR
jgi:hypothetical protein